MAPAHEQCAAALARLTSAISSSSRLSSAAQQLELLNQQLVAAIAALPERCASGFGAGERVLGGAILAALHELSNQRHARDAAWLLELAAVVQAWEGLREACVSSDSERTGQTRQQLAAFVKQQGESPEGSE
jgi:hypothetical protein